MPDSPPRVPTLDDLYREHIEHLRETYSQALARTGFDALLIHAGRPALACAFDDQHWPFRPTPSFAHWAPWQAPNALIALVPGGARPILVYQVVSDFWEGSVEHESHHFLTSFEHVAFEGDAWPLDSLPRPGRVAFVGNTPSVATELGITGEAVNPPALLRELDAIRVHKTGYERLCMGEANRRASVGHAAVAQAFAEADHSELKLHLLYLERTAQDDFQTPYKNIVAMNEHAAVLHHVHYRRNALISNDQSLLLDAGATCLGYASDITRTMVKGPGSRLFADLIARVDALQLEIIGRVRPGLDYESLHDQAHELLASVLRDLGIASASDEELVASGATRLFFPHGLGHSLGIQVHDVGCRLTEPRPDNPFLRNTSPISIGQVFTIEPGCYFIPQLMNQLRGLAVAERIDWSLVDTLAHFGGVRIEDNIAVTEGGTVNLTRDNWTSTP